MDDKKIKVDLESTQLKEVLLYCKPKERLILMRKFGLDGSKETPLQKIGKEYALTRERVRQIETQALMRFRRLIVGNEVYMNVLEESKNILESHGGILGEDVLISKIINVKIEGSVKNLIVINTRSSAFSSSLPARYPPAPAVKIPCSAS